MQTCDNCLHDFKNKREFSNHLPCELTEEEGRIVRFKKLLDEAVELLNNLVSATKYNEDDEYSSRPPSNPVWVYMDQIEDFIKRVND